MNNSFFFFLAQVPGYECCHRGEDKKSQSVTTPACLMPRKRAQPSGAMPTDQAGLANYQNLLANGKTRGALLLDFSESPENRGLFTKVTGLS